MSVSNHDNIPVLPPSFVISAWRFQSLPDSMRVRVGAVQSLFAMFLSLQTGVAGMDNETVGFSKDPTATYRELEQ